MDTEEQEDQEIRMSARDALDKVSGEGKVEYYVILHKYTAHRDVAHEYRQLWQHVVLKGNSVHGLSGTILMCFTLLCVLYVKRRFNFVTENGRVG